MKKIGYTPICRNKYRATAAKTNRLWAALLVGILCLILLTSCGPDTPDESGPGSSMPEQSEADGTTTSAVTPTTTTTITTTTASTTASATASVTTTRPSTATTTRKPTTLPTKGTTTTSGTKSTAAETGPTVIQNQPDAGGEEVLGYSYQTNGKMVDWYVQGDIVYTLFSNPNMCGVFDASTGALLKQDFLPSRPTEIQMIDGELWIAFPDLKTIRIYDPVTMAEKQVLRLPEAVATFALYGDTLFMAEDDQWVTVYRYTMTDQTLIKILPPNGYVFCEADLLINHEEKLLYVAESGYTGSTVYVFDCETLEYKSQYKKDDYGYTNFQRRTILIGNDLYWGEFCLVADNVSQVDRQYSTGIDTGMLWVDENFVITTRGIFDRKTTACYGTFEFPMDSAAVTESGHLMLWNSMENMLYFFIE